MEVCDDISHHTEAVAKRRNHNLRCRLQLLDIVGLHILAKRRKHLATIECWVNVVELPLPYYALRISCSRLANTSCKGSKRLKGAHRRCTNGNNTAIRLLRSMQMLTILIKER